MRWMEFENYISIKAFEMYKSVSEKKPPQNNRH